MSVTLRQHESINLTTGKVTRDHRTETISVPSQVSTALGRNNLRALHLALIESAPHRTPAQSFHLDRLAENQLPALAWVFRKAGRASL
jgi:hypothetical protein